MALMRSKYRAIAVVIIFLILYVSYKILEPELHEHPSGKDTREDQDYFLQADEEKPPHDKDSEEESKHDEFGVRENQTAKVRATIDRLLEMYDLNWSRSADGNTNLWEVAGSWVNHRSVHPENTPEMGAILKKMSTAKILSADTGYRGSQLKMTLVLKGGQRVVFKPKWFERNDLVTGAPYSGPDRHNGEIASFHLNRILGFRRSPLVVGRVINLDTEVKPVAEQRLLNTFYQKDGSTCFYGKCLYCKGEETGVCGRGPKMEGAMVLWMPAEWKLKNWRHPWGRTYVDGRKARWEWDNDYCSIIESVEPYASGPRLLDILDACVFDYLIGNADRHHYETFKEYDDSMLIMLDAAKSFGNPYHDERSILAPLEQCCRLRHVTWERLQQLQDGVLSSVLSRILVKDPISPLLTAPHYSAMDRRLNHILRMVDSCVERKGADEVLIRDKYSKPTS